MEDALLQSMEIYHEAMMTFKPFAVIAMVSGGDDSLLLHHVIKRLGIEVDFVMHGVTGTGVKQTTDFVRDLVANSGTKYLEANAGDAYLKYVMRKGFFGSGDSAHTLSYHVLKAQPFRTAVSRNIRQGKTNRTVLFLNGVRVDESERRADKLGDKIFNIDKAMTKNVWVNLIHWWTTKERDEYLAGNSLLRNPVAIELNRSAECLCGTMQSMATGLQVAEAFPEWGKWWQDIRKKVTAKFPWDWSQNINNAHLRETLGQGNMFKEEPFMPMCVGCKAKVKRTIRGK